MNNITEIILDYSTHYIMSRSKLNKSKIIEFNTAFSVGNLSQIDNYKIILTEKIFEKRIIHNLKKEINELIDSIKCNDKIRLWCSYQDSDSYILLTYISSIIINYNCNLYVIFTDEFHNDYKSPSGLSIKQLEELIDTERKLSNKELTNFSNQWNIVKNQKSDIRIMENKQLKLVQYSYFDNIILNRLNELGEVKIVELIGNLMSSIYLIDIVILYLIKRLINQNKIFIIKKEENLFNCIIKT